MPEREPQTQNASAGEKRAAELINCCSSHFGNIANSYSPNTWEEKSFDIGDILTLGYFKHTLSPGLSRPGFVRIQCRASVLRLDLGISDSGRIFSPIDSYSCFYDLSDGLMKPVQGDVVYRSFIGYFTRTADSRGIIENIFSLRERRFNEQTEISKLKELRNDLRLSESKDSKEIKLATFFVPPLRA